VIVHYTYHWVQKTDCIVDIIKSHRSLRASLCELRPDKSLEAQRTQRCLNEKMIILCDLCVFAVK